MAAWLPQPIMFDMPHTFDCEGFSSEQCQYYKQPWHNWYVADWTFALPTVAFFLCTIGLFIIGHVLTQTLSLSRRQVPSLLQRPLAAIRYLSYRGFHIKALGWNSAPVGLLLLAAVGATYFFCMDLIPAPYYWPGPSSVWGDSPALATRSGWLALACMPFLFATASKTNWITLVTGVTHEKLQIFHRWIAYAFFILALMHTFPFIVWHIRNHDMVYQFTVSSIFEYWTGVVALILQAWLTFASWGPIRSLGYEFFKAAHFFAVIVFILIFFWHCAGMLTSWHYFVATAAVYVPCLTYPWLRTLFEYGLGQKAQIFVEENGFMRITIPANFKWQPGQHCFLRFRSFGVHALSSHPFTICSLPSMSPEKQSELTFYVRHRGGFTARLYRYAIANPGVRVPVLVDGPYGGIDNHKFLESDRLVVVAGGSGAGWMLPFVEQFLRLHAMVGNEAQHSKDEQSKEHGKDENAQQDLLRGPKSLRLILATRDIATRTWFHTTINDLLTQYKPLTNPSILTIEVHLTGSAEHLTYLPYTSNSPSDLERSTSSSITSNSIKVYTRGAKPTAQTTTMEDKTRGRPDLPLIIREEAATAAEKGQNVGVFMCGPLTMQNDVRNAVAEENLRIVRGGTTKGRREGVGGGMYLHLEHFQWA